MTEARIAEDQRRSMAELSFLAPPRRSSRQPPSAPLLAHEPEALPNSPPSTAVSGATQAVRSFITRQVAQMRKLQQERAAEQRRRAEEEAARQRAEEEAAAKRRAEEEARRKAEEAEKQRQEAAAAAAAASSAAAAASAAAGAAGGAGAGSAAGAAAPAASGAGGDEVTLELFDFAGAAAEFGRVRKAADDAFGEDRDEREEFEALFEEAERAGGAFKTAEDAIATATDGFFAALRRVPSVCPSDASMQHLLQSTLLADLAHAQVTSHCRKAVTANIFSEFAMDGARAKFVQRISAQHPDMLKYMVGAICSEVPELARRQRSASDKRLAPVTTTGAVNDMIPVAACLSLLCSVCSSADRQQVQGKRLMNSIWSQLVHFVRDPVSLGDSIPISVMIAWSAWSRCGPELVQRFPKSAPKLWRAIQQKLTPTLLQAQRADRAAQCRLYLDAVADRLAADAAHGYRCQCDRYYEVRN